MLLSTTPVHAQSESTLRGFITASDDGLPLIGVNVILMNPDSTEVFRGTVSNNDGLYVFSRVPIGSYVLRATFIGYTAFFEEITLEPGITTRNISLGEGAAELDEVVVESEAPTTGARVSAGLQTIRPDDLELVPAPDITADLVSFLTTLPGVVQAGDRGGQLFIRGGEASHNMVLLDGMQVFQPFHVLGFYSAFSADFISSADIYAGGYDSRFSGRISSVMDIKTRNGNLREGQRAFSVSPFVNTLRIEGPIFKDRLSVLGSVRQSVIDRFASRYVNQDLPYRFGDLFGKAYLKINQHNQLSFSALHTYDRGALSEIQSVARNEVRWKNTAMGGRYLLLPRGSSVLGDINFSVSRLDVEQGPSAAPERTSSLNSFNASINITNYVGPSEINFGGYLRATTIDASLGGLYQNVSRENSRLPKFGIYVDPAINITSSFSLRPGLTVLFFDQFGFFPEPRLRLTFEKGIHALSAAGGLYHQEIVGLNDRRDATNVFTAWTDPPLDNLTRAWHAMAGYRLQTPSGFAFSAEAYYKWLRDLYISEWTVFPVLTTNLQTANGTSRGVDIRFTYSHSGFYAFISYGLSYVNYTARQESLALWYGTPELSFRPPHDRRHQLNALANYQYGRFSLSVRWNLGSGLPYNQVRGFDRFILLDQGIDVEQVPGDVRVIYDEPYGGLLPAYHRLDLSAEQEFPFKGGRFTIQGGVINIYDRTNIFALDVFTLDRVDQLPFIPTLGAKIEF